ncbi:MULTISPECIES: alpha-2-macroglobulin family protein [unclassified Paracoccus (in: a-proteobacteria)]|uniref:alpha-2-macroglobulin family protein n=1 Tax=unclassified Paracoccus (in: a-proteobacteria) TaxID=2688777 RepID=UPI0021E10EF3|nr:MULTISPECIES: alpha-2-macroglobulin family protein [unclassified Paracoccus (in: a-proteobacteria)]UXU75503.1 alpha-2-macroglobulin family protein [Paracoccus sp. SMMA_5]UXU81408.1 alpha-2-macroglobulin family protein [Paracoccus sp. SMMA_5_TC]
MQNPLARRIAVAVAAASVAVAMLGTPAAGQTPGTQAGALPERRLSLEADTDLPGGDLGPLFDTTLQACVQACLANDDCQALTYNQRSRACFPKGAEAGAPVTFAGALSGRVVTADPEAALAAARRAQAASFLSTADLDAAARQARLMPAQHPPLPGAAGVDQARAAEAAGDLAGAAQIIGALVAQHDRAGDWTDLARLTLYTSDQSDNSASAAIAAMAVNGYLRAGPDQDALAARALGWLAMALERLDRGRDALAALRLAAALAPKDAEIASALEQSQARNGLRVTDTQVESDSPNPRFCAVLSRPLAKGTDYAPFLRLPAGDLTVEADDQRLCVAGLSHGQQVEITLRAGLPAADGEVLARDVALRGYVRDRSPEVRFAGRGYVLPAGGDQRLSMVTVNADLVDLRLLRLSDRNLIRAISERMFATPLDSWQVDYFTDSMAREIWRGQAQVARPMGQTTPNQEVTTSLAIPAEAGPLEPGIYILQANVAGENRAETGVAAQWFVISDLGISTFSGADGLTVVVRSLRDTAPRPGAEVALVSRSNEVLARTATDDQGIARFAPGLSLGRDGAAPALVTVSEWQGTGAQRQARDMAFLSLTDPEFDLSDRGVEGQPPSPPIDIFLTTDRGAYRVGETVNATVLARDARAAALEDLPLTAVLLRPDGVEAARIRPDAAGAGGATLAWTIPATAPRGTWRLELRSQADGPALASTRLLVEDFRPERIDFTPRLPEGPARAGASLPLSLEARWLFGAPAANLPVEGTLRLAPLNSLPGFDGYRFGRHDDDSTPVVTSLPAGTTDAQGRFQTRLDLPPAGELGPRPVEARVVLDVREGAGRPVERSVTRVVMPELPIPGIRPLFEGDTVPENAEARFALIAVGPDLKPAPAPLRWVLNRIDTEYQWYSLGGQWNWEAITSRSRIAEGEAQPGDTPAEIAAPVTWGQYELVVEPASGQGDAAAITFNAGWGALASAGTETPDRLRVLLDKPAYRSGDTARLQVQAASDGLGLVSVLSNRVVALQTVALRAGDNSLELPVTDDWGAGVYVTVSAIRPLQGLQPGDRSPARALGLAHAGVDPGARQLTASLDAPAEARPRGTVPVTLQVSGAAPGDSVHATIAAVDQGILNLTGFQPPDPARHYFGQRRLGVGLRDLYGRLILPSGAPDGALREGGDAMAASAEAPPPTEELMSWFSGPLTLDAQGQARVEVPVGDFNGELRLMAVVWSQQAVGQADASVLMRDPVVMTVTAPAFLAPGDQAELGLRLTHAAGPAGRMQLAISQDGGDAALEASLPQAEIDLAQGAEAQLSLPLAAGADQGLGRLRLTLTTPDGSALTKDIAIPVALNEADIQRQDRLLIQPGESITVPPALTAELLPGAQLGAAIGGFARLDVAGALMRLARYPYGCTEQLASGALPLLYLPALAESQGLTEDSGQAVPQAIARILTRQGSSGGFGLWAADQGDLWLEAYVTDFLSRARSAGQMVPDTAFRQALDNLRNRVNYATEPTAAAAAENAALAYALAVLARERAATAGDLRYYADTAAAAFSTPMAAANLGAALAAYGDQQRADRMFTQARRLIDLDAPEPQGFRADYGTMLRDAAAVLALATEAGSKAVEATELSSQLAQAIARRGEAGESLSTQEAVWTVMAAQALHGSTPPALLNGVAMTRAIATLPADASLANTGDRALEVTLTATGKPAASPDAGGRGYTIRRSHYNLQGEALDPASLPQGQRLVVVIDVIPQAEGGGRLIVTDPLPAGWEIDNPNLLRAGDVAALDWLEGQTEAEMVEFRADRFAAALNWTSAEPFRLAYIARAVTPGRYRHPAASVEDMYRPEYRAWTDGGSVAVTR